jgi:hypothetical protein
MPFIHRKLTVCFTNSALQFKRLQQQSRYQFRSSPHSKLDEDVAQVEFHRLLTYQQSQPDLRVRQSFNTTQSHLRFATA